jgi:hypothetical protein
VNPETTTITKDFSAVAKKELDINTWRSVYFTGAEFTTKISKVFDVKNSFWQINQLRHLIEPRADYVYQHEPTVQADDLLDFGDLDYKQNYIALGVRNKLQTKRETAWDLIDFWMGTNYYPRKYKDMPIASDRKFSNIYMDLRIIPFDWLEMDMYSYWDQYDKQIDTYSNDFVFYKNDKLSFGIGYRYQRAQDKLWTSEINYTINSNWALRLVHWFEFETGQLQQQEYVLVRDLHCWNLAFSFRKYHNTDETAGFVVLYPKAYPDMPITFGTTYFGANDTAEVDFGMD